MTNPLPTGEPTGTGTGAQPPAGDAPTPTPPGRPNQPPAQPPADPWASYKWDGNVDNLPPDVAKVIRDARADAAKNRTDPKVAAQEARNKLLRQLAADAGLIEGDDTPPDPAKLTAALQESRQGVQSAREEAAAAQIELMVYRSAIRAGADAERLLDSRSFVDAIDEIDYKDEADFRSQVEQKIKAALEKDPTLRAGGQAPARIGVEHTGGPGGAGRLTSLGAAVRAAYGQG